MQFLHIVCYLINRMELVLTVMFMVDFLMLTIQYIVGQVCRCIDTDHARNVVHSTYFDLS